jgi:hypothetical protein
MCLAVYPDSPEEPRAVAALRAARRADERGSPKLEKRSGVLAFFDDLAAFPTAFPVRIFRCGGLDRGGAVRRGESTLTMPWTRQSRENKRGTVRYMDRLHGA